MGWGLVGVGVVLGGVWEREVVRCVVRELVVKFWWFVLEILWKG